MSVTADQAGAMAFLSWATYDYSQTDPAFPLTTVTAADNLTGSGWSVLNPAVDGGSYHNGFYINGAAAALIASKDNTISISFRGTDFLPDLAFAEIDQAGYFDKFRPLINALASLVADIPGKYTNLYVDGHSLGGIMAEWFTAEYGVQFQSLDLDVSIATFGDPGVDSLQFPASVDSKTAVLLSHIVNFGHSEDNVFNEVSGITGLKSSRHRSDH